MSDETHDALWGELWSRALRAGPRLAPHFGECASCFLGASDAADVGGITWAYCLTCMTRWPVLDRFARLDPAPDGFLELFVEALSMCIDLDPLPQGITPPAFPVADTIREEDSPMPRPTAPKSFRIDPHLFLSARELRPLGRLTPAERIAATDAIVNDLADHPEIVQRHPLSHVPMINPSSTWSRIRDQAIYGDDTFEQVLRRAEVAGPTIAIQNVISVLTRVLDERPEHEKALRASDALAAVFPRTREHVEA